MEIAFLSVPSKQLLMKYPYLNIGFRNDKANYIFWFYWLKQIEYDCG